MLLYVIQQIKQHVQLRGVIKDNKDFLKITTIFLNKNLAAVFLCYIVYREVGTPPL